MVMIRQPIIGVLGHVDHGKTTLLDRIRHTAIASKEVGGITQHIGASEVPLDVIKEICKDTQSGSVKEIKIPGLLFVDTPGHEAFTNLRRRGSSVADLAILVIDVSKGFEPQTIEAINILREYKTPFIVAANKIDLITGWRSLKTNSFAKSLASQEGFVKERLDNTLYEFVGRLSELGFNADLFSNIKDFNKSIAIVPISAKTGEGIAELLLLVAGLAQKYLEMKLTIEVKGPGRGSILEKKEERGLGVTIDVILYDGTLRVNDTIAFAAVQNSVATAKIKALLKPKPLHEMRESTSKFYYVDSVSAASGVKISAIGLDDAIPGSPLVQVIKGKDYIKDISAELGEVFKEEDSGPILKADSIGSIEAISKLFAASGTKISKRGIGNVTKRDVIDAFAMNAIDPTSAIVLAFDVGAEPEAEKASLASNVRIIQSNTIYKLVEEYSNFIEEKKRQRQKELEEKLTMPAKFLLIPNMCFRVSHPAIFGIEVLEGTIKQGYAIINSIGEFVGRIKSLENEGTPLQSARRGDKVAISMDGPAYGRQVRAGETLYTMVSAEDAYLFRNKFSDNLNDNEKALLEEIISIMNKAHRSI